MSTHTPGPWIVGKSGRLQTKPNAAGGCTVIIDESIRFNPDRELLVKAPIAPKLAEALRDCIGSLQSCASWIPHDSGGAIAREVVQAEVKRYSAALAEWDAQS